MSRYMSYVLCFLFVPFTLQAGPTGVGSGGDIVDRFLGSTRQSLVESLSSIATGPFFQSLCRCDETVSTDGLCSFLKQLTGDQKTYCDYFLRTAVPQILRLNLARIPTPFALSEVPLYLTLPTGKRRRVLAKTELGPAGEIVFEEQSLRRYLTPADTLFLMAHEFGHKVEFGGLGNWVEDNNAIGPFAFEEGGRRLLDSAAAAIVRYGASRGLVPQYYGIKDSFSCEIIEKTSGQSFSAEGSSRRLYRDLTRQVYETGIGNMPQDFYCYRKEAHDISRLYFRVRIHEEASCDASKDERRWTQLELWRVPTSNSEKNVSKPERLDMRMLKGWNPICKEATAQKMELEYNIGSQHLIFEVRYRGSFQE